MGARYVEGTCYALYNTITLYEYQLLMFPIACVDVITVVSCHGDGCSLELIYIYKYIWQTQHDVIARDICIPLYP